jgi:acyl carrier protein
MNATTLQSEACAEATAALDRLRGIWQRLLNQQASTDDQEFFDAGGNSVLLLGMLELIREEFGREIAIEELADGISVSRLAGLLAC